MQFNISPGTSHRGTAPEVQAAGEQREPLGFRHCRAQRNVLLQTGKSSQAQQSDKPTAAVPRELAAYLTSLRSKQPLMILPQVHLRKPCYDFYFL